MRASLEHIITSHYKADMITYMESYPEQFEEAITLALSDKQPYCWRAASILWSCMEENDRRIRKYLQEIIDCLPAKKQGHQRELLKILMRMELNEIQEGKLFNLCVELWEDTNNQPSVRYMAFQSMVKIAKKHPDLFREIDFLTENQYLNSLSPAVRKGIKKIIKNLSL